MSGTSFTSSAGRKWQISTFLLLLVSLALLISLVVVATRKDKEKVVKIACDGADHHYEICGSAGTNPNGNVIDLSEPASPGPFHDLTTEELRKLRTFLVNNPETRVSPMDQNLNTKSSYISIADLWVPPKTDVINFLDNGGPQPPRQARVMIFRGDKSPPVVEEWICGPLPDVTSCELLDIPQRRNPVEFESRPFSTMEFQEIFGAVIPEVEAKIGHILKESYNASYLDCTDPMDCLTFNPVPMASALTGKLKQRRMWFWAVYELPYPLLHPLDFGLLLQLDGSDATKWGVEKVWYSGNTYQGLEDLLEQYTNGSIPKSKFTRPAFSSDLYSTLTRRGDPSPSKAQRPPTLVEPDGKRYSLKGRKVEYLNWSFNFRLSPYFGPALFDIRFKGERIAYELSLSEFAAFYSGNSPLSQSTDYVDSGAISGLGSKSLVPGGDCPDTATLVNYTLMNQHGSEPGVYDSVFCLFEHNNGYPLRRHLQYAKPTGFYGGMLDSVLTLRAALTVGNYDYIVDFIFHQNGALETRLMSTGYIQSNVYREVERLYGFKIEDHILGNLHHHIFNIKADLDIGGTSNRYETLDIQREKTNLTWDSNVTYHQTKFTSTLKTTEKDSLYHYNFDTPKDHVVFNEAQRNKNGEKRAFRIHLSGMSKNLYTEGEGNEPAISWARHQIAVTKQKDEEFRSSSNYAMYDTLDPVVDFSRFYADNESIVDEDLVFWLTLGLHHIPHTEDLPVTPTAGNHLTAFLLPYNYFDECPSMGSRDAIFVSYKNRMKPEEGLTLDRNGNSRGQCVIPKPTLEEVLEQNPDQVLETRRVVPSI